jgi:hypothetical protein
MSTDTSVEGRHPVTATTQDVLTHHLNSFGDIAGTMADSNGSVSIPDVIRALPDDYKYEMAMVVAEGEYVMIHGRYTGWAPKPAVAVDIFRVVGGKLVEHWDVMQEEVPAGKTVSGNPMFIPLGVR